MKRTNDIVIFRGKHNDKKFNVTMKHSPTRWITCKCDACMDELRFSPDEPITALFDTVSGMLVCEGCKDDFTKSATVYGSNVNWHGVPERRLNYDVQEYEFDEDYLND